MNAYTATLAALLSGLLVQLLICGLAIEDYLRSHLPIRARRPWIAIFIASTLLAVHDAYALELALRTGLYDLRQAVLVALAAGGLLLGVYGFRRQAA